MKIYTLIRFILNHPLNKKNKLKALKRFIFWQINSFLSPYPVIYPFTTKSKLVISKGMTGATQNIYCGLHDYVEMLFLLHLLRETDHFIDIGANIGSYSILASGHVGSKSISFEPVPSTFKNFKTNIAVNGIEHLVNANNIALGSKKDILKFTNTLDTINHVAEEGEENIIEVEVSTLDSFTEHTIPLLIKIDVEGFETEVLNGAKNTLEQTELKGIIIELNNSGKRYGYADADIHKKLLEYGFLPHSYDPANRKLIPLESYGNHNTLYLRDLEFVQNRLKSASPILINGSKY